MAIDNFIPELWSAAVQVPYEDALVFGQPAVANRAFEGQLRQQGDTVHVTSITSPTISTYDKNADIVTEDLSDASISLTVDHGNVYSFRVNDIDEVQAAGNFRSPALTQAGYGLSAAADAYIASQFALAEGAGGPANSNQLGAFTVPAVDPSTVGKTDTAAYKVLVKLREVLDKKSVPTPGRYVVVSPEFISALLLDKRYTDLSASGSTDALLNGQVGRATGFEVLVSNRLPVKGGKSLIVAGIPDALSYVSQLSNTEAIRDNNRFADKVRGLNIYGAKIFRPEAVATAQVTVTDSAAIGA